MAVDKYINVNNDEVEFTVISTGGAQAGKGVGLDPTGRLDTTVLPVGMGPSKVSVQAVGGISAGYFVNLYVVAGALRMRLADATDDTKPLHGFVLHDVVDGANGDVYMIGNINTALAGLTIGHDYYLSKVAPGTLTDDVSAYSGGNIVQYAGFAISATQLIFGNPQFKKTI